MSRTGATLLLSLLLSVFVTGCASPYKRPDYVFNPKDDKETATLFLRTSGIIAPAYFYISESTKFCKGFSSAGYVFNMQREKHPVASKVADAANALKKALFLGGLDEVKERERVVPAGKPIQIQVFGNASTSDAVITCGPITSQFTPVANKKYRADFSWAGGKCYMTIRDITDGSSLSNVNAHSYNYCRRDE